MEHAELLWCMVTLYWARETWTVQCLCHDISSHWQTLFFKDWIFNNTNIALTCSHSNRDTNQGIITAVLQQTGANAEEHWQFKNGRYLLEMIKSSWKCVIMIWTDIYCPCVKMVVLWCNWGAFSVWTKIKNACCFSHSTQGTRRGLHCN